MANYTAAQMTAGALGEVLNAGQQYEFTLTTPTYLSQSVYFNAASFVVDSSTFTNANLQGSSTNPIIGALKGGLIPLSNTVGSITGGPHTFLFDVVGDLQGGDAQISLTSNGGVITRAEVVRGGENFTSGDGITISQNDLQAAGFSNADASQQLDLFPDHIEGAYVSSDLSGAFANFTTDVSQSNLIASSRGFAFNFAQAVGSGGGTFDFTPDVTIPVNSYLLKSTGHITLNISPA